MSREPTRPTPEAVINAAYDLATMIAESSLDTETLTLVASSLDDALAAATGRRTQEDIDRLAAELMIRAVGEVDTNTSSAKRLLQQSTAEAWLSHLGDARAQELLDRQRWADATEPSEPWDGPEDPALPALSSPPSSVLGVAYPEDPAQPGEASEANGDYTEQGGDHADGDDAADGEVVDAEIVEVEQVTSSQRRYRTATPGAYSPAARPAFARSLTRGKPTTMINTASEHLGDQR